MIYQATLEMPRLERVYSGQPAAESLAQEVERLAAKRVFLICSKTLRETTKEIAAIERVLCDKLVGIFDGVRAHVPREDVIAASIAAEAVSADLLISLGGGSVSDATKIVAVCLKHQLFRIEMME